MTCQVQILKKEVQISFFLTPLDKFPYYKIIHMHSIYVSTQLKIMKSKKGIHFLIYFLATEEILLWPRDMKSQLTGKGPDARKD